MNKIFVATRNPNKVKEISAKLKGFKIVSLSDYPDLPDIEETGRSFFENAKLKAKTIFNILHIPVLADDSGLEVDCLNGQPGIYSARYAGEGASQSQLIKKLLTKMQDCKNRNAHFTTVMVFIDKTGRIHRSTGKVYGLILEKPAGKNGFGYDPVFYYPQLGKTFAQLTREGKNAVSHRGKALEKITDIIKKNRGNFL